MFPARISKGAARTGRLHCRLTEEETGGNCWEPTGSQDRLQGAKKARIWTGRENGKAWQADPEQMATVPGIPLLPGYLTCLHPCQWEQDPH